MIDPDEFDTLVQDTLRAVDADTHTDPSLADRLIANAREGETKVVALHWPRRAAARIAPLIAAAAVAVVVLALVFVGHHSGGRSATTATSSLAPPTVLPSTQVVPSPSSTAPTETPSRPALKSSTHSAPTTSAGTHEPPVSYYSPKAQHFVLTQQQYISQNEGWELGDAKCPTSAKTDCATLLHTTDAGNHWTKVAVPAGVVSTKDYGSCGDNGDILGPCIDAINFANSHVGYTWSHHDLYVTTDGGLHWTNLDTQYVYDLQFVGQRVARLTGRYACSSGCTFGVFSARLGSSDFTQVVPWSTNPSFWQLASGGGLGYLLEVLWTAPGTSSPNAIYRSTDGVHWTKLTGAVPCGKRDIRAIKVDSQGKLTATCG